MQIQPHKLTLQRGDIARISERSGVPWTTVARILATGGKRATHESVVRVQDALAQLKAERSKASGARRGRKAA